MFIDFPWFVAAPSRGHATLTPQHSLSGGNISEHEKWEKEGGMEYTIRRGKSTLGGREGGSTNKNRGADKNKKNQPSSAATTSAKGK